MNVYTFARMKRKKTHVETLRRNVERYMKDNGASYRALEEISGVGYTTIFNLVRKGTVPLYDKGMMLSEAIGAK